MRPGPVRVLLVDDHQMPAEALAARLSTVPDIVVVGHCSTRDPRPEVLADELGLSVHTVRTHTNKIFAKLGVHSRLEAVTVTRRALRGTRSPATGVAVALSAQEVAQHQ